MPVVVMVVTLNGTNLCVCNQCGWDWSAERWTFYSEAQCHLKAWRALNGEVHEGRQGQETGGSVGNIKFKKNRVDREVDRITTEDQWCHLARYINSKISCFLNPTIPRYFPRHHKLTVPWPPPLSTVDYDLVRPINIYSCFCSPGYLSCRCRPQRMGSCWLHRPWNH